MRILAFHLLNDYSGSPKVLKQLLNGWSQKGIQTILYTNSSTPGFLSKIDQIEYRKIHYRFIQNKLGRVFQLLMSQLILFFEVLLTAKKSDIIYVNTVLPFGAAYAGKIRGSNVVYHIHETSVKPKILKSFLFASVRLCASKVIYVSDFLSQEEKTTSTESFVLHNALETDFVKRADFNKSLKTSAKNVLMICSLKAYKGVYEFVELAKLTPEMNFKLVLNSSKTEIDVFFSDTFIAPNLTIHPTQSDVSQALIWSDVLLNLSRPTEWIETFGLTVIEAMAYGVPAIIPPIGGIAELIKPGKNGYQLASDDINKIRTCLRKLKQDNILYSELSLNAYNASKKYNESTFIENNLTILNLKTI